MKKYLIWILIPFLLNGCSDQTEELKAAIDLRSKLLQGSGCAFALHITVDYGSKIQAFSLDCSADSTGAVSFTVLDPDTISGISGKLSSEGGEITFTDTALYFPLLVDGQLSPISAPWVLIHCLTNGYFSSACTEENQIRLSIDDNYEKIPLRLDLWLNARQEPARAELLCDGRKILSVDVANFVFL